MKRYWTVRNAHMEFFNTVSREWQIQCTWACVTPNKHEAEFWARKYLGIVIEIQETYIVIN